MKTLYRHVLCVTWPSIVSQRTGIGGQVDPDGHGYASLNSTSNYTTLASTRIRSARYARTIEEWTYLLTYLHWPLSYSRF